MLTTSRVDDRASAVIDLADKAFSSFDFSDGAVVAISGGSDSTALLLLLKHYFDRFAPRAPLLAVTIDHALRVNSADEAMQVARLCAAHGIAHRTLAWSGEKPATGIPAAAREARYRLLSEAASTAGIGLVVTAHTADDQAETVSMRQARTEGSPSVHERGLAGMAPATLFDWTTWIARPLLDTRRADLRAFLRSRNVDWIEDPTNSDQDYERARVRAALGLQAPGRIASLLNDAKGVAAEREALSCRAALVVTTFASRAAPGLIRVDPAIATGDRQAANVALRTLLATAGGASFLPDGARVTELLDRIGGNRFCATLSRTVLDARRNGIFLYRERRGLPQPCRAEGGMIWDGRRRISLRDDAVGIVINAGDGSALNEVAEPGNPFPASLVAAARAAEPAFALGAGDAAAEANNPPKAAAVAVVSPFARFLPSFDLELAAAVSDLVGASALPASPLRTEKSAATA